MGKIQKGKYCTFDCETEKKTYKEKHQCDFAYETQKKAYKLGIGPEVIRRIDDFSYISEVVDTEEFATNKNLKRWLKGVYPELFEKLKPLFVNSPRVNPNKKDNVDLSKWNIGRDKKGNVVMVDFY